jgi:plasmid stabilization system protein ParE
MLINLTNHPSALWDGRQKEAAERDFGKIVDVPFPTIQPEADEGEVNALVEEYARRIADLPKDGETYVHVMGEMTFTVAMVKRLMQQGITCVASTTERSVVDLAGGGKVVQFHFVRFRRYI